jgi:hypothetical protein
VRWVTHQAPAQQFDVAAEALQRLGQDRDERREVRRLAEQRLSTVPAIEHVIDPAR